MSFSCGYVMTERRSQGSMIVSPPRAGDAIGAALRNVFRTGESFPGEWDLFVTRIDHADRSRRI